MGDQLTGNNGDVIRVLVVDDDPVVHSAIQEQLHADGFHVTAVATPHEALELAQREAFTIALADQEMPGTSGLELLARIQEISPGTIRVLTTTSLTLPELVEALRVGTIYRFVIKPWLREELLSILRSAASQVLVAAVPAAAAAGDAGEAAGALAEGEIATESGEPGAPAKPPSLVTAQNAEAAVDVFLKMLGTFHPNLQHNANRAVALCKTIARNEHLSLEDTRDLLWAAALHDISLVDVERGIVRRWLRDPAKCTPEEIVSIKRHPEQAVQMLDSYPVFQPACEIIKAHQENWDGSGYPSGLQGEMIPLLARLLAPVLAYCSGDEVGPEALKQVAALAEKTFDPHAVEALEAAVPATTLPHGAREILLINLKPGMMLAQDIVNASGMLLMAKGRELTIAWHNKILNINNSTPINPLVRVVF